MTTLTPAELMVLREAAYFPGTYSCRCITCHSDFEGAKGAWRCLECATGLVKLLGIWPRK